LNSFRKIQTHVAFITLVIICTHMYIYVFNDHL
jgi:hypothetical protein